jgi:hypothetical protein
MPAKAGIQNYLKLLDSRLRGNDVKGNFKTFCETINIQLRMWFVSLLYSVFPGIQLKAISRQFDVQRSMLDVHLFRLPTSVVPPSVLRH